MDAGGRVAARDQRWRGRYLGRREDAPPLRAHAHDADARAHAAYGGRRRRSNDSLGDEKREYDDDYILPKKMSSRKVCCGPRRSLCSIRSPALERARIRLRPPSRGLSLTWVGVRRRRMRAPCGLRSLSVCCGPLAHPTPCAPHDHRPVPKAKSTAPRHTQALGAMHRCHRLGGVRPPRLIALSIFCRTRSFSSALARSTRRVERPRWSAWTLTAAALLTRRSAASRLRLK